jgi:hypothetical protein
MKVKSLLFAAAAMLALGASAQNTEWTGKLSLSAAPEDFVPGEVEAVVVLDEVGNLPNFTNAQFTFDLPDGITVDYIDVVDDTKALNDKGRKVQPLGWASNMVGNEGRCIGTNMNKVKIEVFDGMEIASLVFVVEDGFEPEGKKIEMFDNKFTTYENETFEMPRFVAVEFPTGGGDAVNDVNVNKAVSSVKYYNAAGVAADSAFDGVNIVVTKYADGSQKVSKVVK